MKAIVFLLEHANIEPNTFIDELVSAGFQPVTCNHYYQKPFVRADTQGLEISLLIYSKQLTDSGLAYLYADSAAYVRELEKAGVPSLEVEYQYDDPCDLYDNGEAYLDYLDEIKVQKLLKIKK